MDEISIITITSITSGWFGLLSLGQERERENTGPANEVTSLRNTTQFFNRPQGSPCYLSLPLGITQTAMSLPARKTIGAEPGGHSLLAALIK